MLVLVGADSQLRSLGDSWRLAAPACLFVLQSNLRFIGAENLDAPTFQITNNLELLTTALFSVALLRRRLTRRKWAALFLLAAGVGVLHSPSFEALTELEMAYGQSGTRVRGLVAIALSCCASALAGAILEPVFTASKVDLVVQNCRIAVFGLVPAFLLAMFPSCNLLGPQSAPPHTSFLANLSPTAWTIVLTQALGSVVSSLSTGDLAVLNRGFASSLAFPVSLVAGWFCFGFQVTPQFLAGQSYLYSDVALNNTDMDHCSGSLWIILATYLHNSIKRHPNATLRAPPLPHHSYSAYSLKSTRTFRPPPSVFGPTPPSPSRKVSPPSTPRRATLCEPRTPPAHVDEEKSPYDEEFGSIVAVHGIVRSASITSLSSLSSPSLASGEDYEPSWVPLASPGMAVGIDDVQRMV